MSENMKKVWGEFAACAFVSCFGLGILVPFAVLGYVQNMYEFSVWFGVVFILTVMIFVPISGAHLNPGVTFAWAIFGDFDKKLVAPYCIAQTLGWGIGLIPVVLIFGTQLGDWAAAGNNPATLWFCGSGLNGDIIGGGLAEFFMSAFLLIGIFACCDDKLPNKPSPALFPVAIGVIIAVLVAWGGGFTGTAINPSRDFGPRVFGYIYGLIMGYDTSSIFAGWTWVMYLVAPTLGCVAGAWLYSKVVVKLLPVPTKED